MEETQEQQCAKQKEKEAQKLAGLREIYDVKTWLNIHVSQLSYTRNLLIVLASAEIGFVLGKTESNGNELIYKVIMIFSAISVGVGLLLALNEESNFRKKRQISRLLARNKSFEAVKAEYLIIENECTKLEERNKYLFWTQSLLFAIATFFIGLLVMQ